MTANSAKLNDATPTFVWTTVPDATSYELQVASDSQFNTIVFAVSGVITTQTPNTSLGIDHVYYWHVRGLSSVGNGPWSSVGTFTLDTQPPLTPTLLTPADASSTDNNLPNLVWQTVGDAFQYEIRWNTVNPPTGTGSIVSGTQFTVPAPLLVTTYYWQVRSIDAAGNISAWSIPFSIVILSPPNAAPIRNYITSFPMVLTWNGLSWATAYEIEVSNNPSFAPPLHYHQALIPPNTLQATIASLPSGTYYWHVRAKKPDGTWSGWSLTDSFEVLNWYVNVRHFMSSSNSLLSLTLDIVFSVYFSCQYWSNKAALLELLGNTYFPISAHRFCENSPSRKSTQLRSNISYVLPRKHWFVKWLGKSNYFLWVWKESTLLMRMHIWKPQRRYWRAYSWINPQRNTRNVGARVWNVASDFEAT